MTVSSTPVKARRIVKRYTSNVSGNQFARVEFSDGGVVDVRTRVGRQGRSLFSGASEIKAEAARLRFVEGRTWS